MEWTEDAVLSFIEMYREKEILWDTKHPAHYHKVSKNLAWEEIAEHLQITTDECKRKMSGLMSSLRREKAKIKKSPQNGRSEVYQSNWFAFKSLLFLLDKRKAQVPVVKEEGVDLREENDDDQSSKCEEIGTILSPECRLQTNSSHTLTSAVPRKRSVTEDDSIQIASKLSKFQEQSEHDIFGKLVATKLKKYSKFAAISVQEEIMHIIFQADRGFYDQQPAENCSLFSQHLSGPGTSNA